MVIGATVGASVRTAVGSTIAQVGRLGQAVVDAERQKAEALKETARLDKTERQINAYRQLGRQGLQVFGVAGVVQPSGAERLFVDGGGHHTRGLPAQSRTGGPGNAVGGHAARIGADVSPRGQRSVSGG